MMYLPRLLSILSLATLTSPVWAGGILPYEIGTPEVGTAAFRLPHSYSHPQRTIAMANRERRQNHPDVVDP